MHMYDIIERKRDGGELTDGQIAFAVDGYTRGAIPDYQMSALLMAIYLRGMTPAETLSLTLHMMRSGECVDLSGLPGSTVDKHSTGGVGDKTSIAVVPMLAAMDPGGTFMAKMSGRGLGHTGGTLDKLESIPGFTCELSQRDFLACVKAHGGAIVGQTGNLVPADKLMYALRDVTATVGSIPLIASSIMSKKLAAGSACILLDVKVGSGAFMKTVPDAVELAQTMVRIGCDMGRRVEALITNMDRPLGHAIGNALEVAEVVDTLQGRGPADLTHEAVMLASTLLALTGRFDMPRARRRAQAVIDDGSAFAKLIEIVAAQGGDTRALYDTALLPGASLTRLVQAPSDGYVSHIDTEQVGLAAAQLGGGRIQLGDAIDHGCGILLRKNYDEPVVAGETVAELRANDADKLAAGAEALAAAISYAPAAPAEEPLLYATVTAEGVVYA